MTEPATTGAAASDGSVLPLSELAYSKIRAAVVSGAIQPGSLFREADLVRQLGVSRTPIREALRRLQTEGLIAATPPRGFLVLEVSPDELAEIYRVREVLEALAAHLAAERHSRVDLAVMEECLDVMESAYHDHDDDALAAANRDFHDAIAAASHNRYLIGVLREAREVFERYRPVAIAKPRRRTAAHDEHRRLLEAIRNGDAQQAADIVSAHVSEALRVRLGAV